MPRRKKTTRQRHERSAYHTARLKMMLDANVQAKDVYAHVRSLGLSYSTVAAVLEGRFRNDDIVRAFCELTHTSSEHAFPNDEPPYRRQRADDQSAA